MLWDQWCKKLFLSNAVWLTFPADTDKRMGVSKTLAVCVQVGKKEKRGGENK